MTDNTVARAEPDKREPRHSCPYGCEGDCDVPEHLRGQRDYFARIAELAQEQIERRINRLERVVLELAARPLPGHDFHHLPWPPEGELGDIHKLHHTERRDTHA